MAPVLVYEDISAAIEWLREAFGFVDKKIQLFFRKVSSDQRASEQSKKGKDARCKQRLTASAKN